MAGYLMSLTEVARILRRHPSSVRRMIREGRFPLEVITTMGIQQVRRADLEAYLHLHHGELAEVAS